MKKLTLVITILAAIGISSCKKGWLDESKNPNASVSTTLAASLTSSEKGASDIVNGWGSYTGQTWIYSPYAIWGGYWIQNPSGYIQDAVFTQYSIQTTTAGFPWSDLYENLSNLHILEINSKTATPNANYHAISLVLEAYDFEQLVDNYNNVPYSQAFEGINNLTPAYDSGASIYANLILKMDTAINLINTNAAKSLPDVSPSSDDIVFQGNMTSWKKFANTMKLRLIIRQSNLSGFSALKTELNSTFAEGYLDGTTQATAQPGYALSDAYGGQESPFFLCYGERPNGSTTLYGFDYYLANSFCVNLMNSLNDTSRLVKFYQTVDGSTNADMVVGGTNGSTNIPAEVSAIGPGLLNATAPSVLFSGAESLFLQAEAVNDGMMAGTASTLYDAGITASFVATGAESVQTPAVVVNGVIKTPAVYYTPTESAAIYYAQPSVATVNEQNIITQKYISLNGYGVFEAYNEIRRTGYPGIPRSVNIGALGSAGQIPSIIFYPQIEYSTNPVNVGKQPAATVATEFNDKIFWAK